VALGLVVFSFGIFGEVLNRFMEPRAITHSSRKIAGEPISNTTLSTLDIAKDGLSSVLTVRELRVAPTQNSDMPLIADVSFSLGASERMAIVGESGAGKSILVKAILDLLPPQLTVTNGQICYQKTELLKIDKKMMRSLRLKHIAATLTNAKSQLHPMTTVGAMMASAVRAHERLSHREIRQRSIELLRMVGMNDPERRLDAYPHELSGGMAQRVCLALALMYRPKLLVADEPTAGLDVTIQRQVLDLMQKLTHESGTSQLVVTADLGIAAQYCDVVAVMHSGRIVEINRTRDFFRSPTHPYSRALLDGVRV
jgi:peptide/nickel transport system permease protein